MPTKLISHRGRSHFKQWLVCPKRYEISSHRDKSGAVMVALARHMPCAQYIWICQHMLSCGCKTRLVVQPRFSEWINVQNLQLHKNAPSSWINLQLTIVIFKKSMITDMHHRITYMYINFQQNRVCRSVKTVNTNIFAINRITYMRIHIQQKRGVDQSKPCTQIYLKKIASCINLQLAIRISKPNFFQICITPMSSRYSVTAFHSYLL